jgi:putative chitinase
VKFPVTDAHLTAIGVPSLLRSQYLPHLNKAMAGFEIDHGERPAMFVAQVAHESGLFQYLNEIWGPTQQQRKYDNGSALSIQLGNHAGDGFRFRGHGLIQVTGRYNHEKVARRFGISMDEIVGWLTHPEGACLSAAHFWASNGCNALADAFDFVGVTRRINGGLNGLANRTELYQKLSLQP